MKNQRLIYFFDPPFTEGVEAKTDRLQLMNDFKPYPMRYALTMAFTQTDNVMLKLPKNIDLEMLKFEIA
jgi:hypothetical protein